MNQIKSNMKFLGLAIAFGFLSVLGAIGQGCGSGSSGVATIYGSTQ